MVDLKEGAVFFPVEDFVHERVPFFTFTHRPLGGGVNDDGACWEVRWSVFAGGGIINTYLTINEDAAGKYI